MASRYSNTTSSIETVRLLLDSGADVNVKKNDKYTPLLISSQNSNGTSSIETVKLLLDSGANINDKTKKGNAALMLASYKSNDTSSNETVKLLLDSGADVNLKNINDKTALNLASYNNNIETIKLLLDYGANPFIDGINVLDVCTTVECKKLISKYMWKRMHQNIKLLSRQYSRSGIARFPKDIWELILLRNKQKQLCKNLSSSKNKYILINFALLYEIPVNDNMSKSTLCNLISKQLSYGERYSQRSVDYFKTKDGMIQLGILAKTLGIDREQPIEEILNDVTTYLLR